MPKTFQTQIKLYRGLDDQEELSLQDDIFTLLCDWSLSTKTEQKLCLSQSYCKDLQGTTLANSSTKYNPFPTLKPWLASKDVQFRLHILHYLESSLRSPYSILEVAIVLGFYTNPQITPFQLFLPALYFNPELPQLIPTTPVPIKPQSTHRNYSISPLEGDLCFPLQPISTQPFWVCGVQLDYYLPNR